MTDLTLVRATPADLDTVAALSRALYAEHPGPLPMDERKVEATLRHFDANPASGEVLLVRRGETTVGMTILARYWSNEYGGVAVVLDELYLLAAHRGGGLGTEVLGRIEARARETGSVVLLLEVDDDNPRARQLYERVGYRPTGRHHYRKILPGG